MLISQRAQFFFYTKSSFETVLLLHPYIHNILFLEEHLTTCSQVAEAKIKFSSRARVRALPPPCRWRFARPPARTQPPNARPPKLPGRRARSAFVLPLGQIELKIRVPEASKTKVKIRKHKFPVSVCACVFAVLTEKNRQSERASEREVDRERKREVD